MDGIHPTEGRDLEFYADRQAELEEAQTNNLLEQQTNDLSERQTNSLEQERDIECAFEADDSLPF